MDKSNSKEVPKNESFPLMSVEISEIVPCEDKTLGRKILEHVKRNLLLLLTVVGVIVGFGIGFGVRPAKPSDTALMWIGILGELYMRSLKVTILPLIVSSVIAGAASMDPKSNGKVSILALVYVLVTNLFGVLLALALFFSFNIGNGIASDAKTNGGSEKSTQLQTEDIFADMIRNLLPDNIITACFQKSQTTYLPSVSTVLVNGTEVTTKTFSRKVGTTSGTNILGLIIICTLIGMATAKVGEIGRPFVQFFKATSDVVIQALRWLIWFTPIGVASLIAHAVAKETNIESTFRSLGMFVMAYVVGIVLLLIVAIPVAYFIVVRKNPFVFLYHLLRPFVTAFATASSAVAIPEVLHTCESKHGVTPNISRFFVPFATALNRTGSCIFITMSGLLLCTMEGYHLEGVKVLFLAILSTVSSLAIPGVPSGSIICILIILSSIGVHTTNIGLLMAVEWFTDRLRTGANIASITFGAIFIHVVCKDSLNLASDSGQLDADDSLDEQRNQKDGIVHRKHV